MTHKANCIRHCKEHLQSRCLDAYYNNKDFEHIYRKFEGAQGNAFSIGLDAADFMIINAQPESHDTGNEN